LLYEIDVNNGNVLRQSKDKFGTAPSFILLSKDESLIYVIDSNSDRMYFIDAESLIEKRSPAGVGLTPSYACMSSDGSLIFIVSKLEQRVYFFDTNNYILSKKNIYFLGKEPKGVAADKDNLYVCLSSSNELAVVDIKTGLVTGKISVDKGPVSVIATEHKLYVIDGTGIIEVFDKNNFQQERKKFLGIQPQSAILSGDGKYIYMLGPHSVRKSASIVGIYDISSGELVRRLDIDYQLDFMTCVRLE
jgi:YVTN family beta-propeller protein